METQHKRSAFSGKLGFVLSAAGASVGLGNIWRFPYLAAKYGGGIFLLIYILLAVTFGYTMIIAETALGRMTRKSPVGAYSHFGKGKGLAFGGWINAVRRRGSLCPIVPSLRAECNSPAAKSPRRGISTQAGAESTITAHSFLQDLWCTGHGWRSAQPAPSHPHRRR